MKSDRTKWRITSFLLILALIAEIYVLLFSKKRPNTTSSTPVIAQLVYSKNSVRYQNPGELVWDEISPQQTLFQEEQILTLDRSRAEIAFLDGTGLSMDENSLILLQRNSPNDLNNGEKITVRLLRGAIRKTRPNSTVNSSISLEIQVGNMSTVLPPESELMITAMPEQGGGAQIQVNQGELQVHSEHGIVSVKKGEDAKIFAQKNKAPQISAAPSVTLLSPLGGDVFEGIEALQISFFWKVTGKGADGSSMELEVSHQPDFSSGVKKLRIGNTEPPLKQVLGKVIVPVNTTPTLWYWRVKTLGNPPTVSKVEKFWIQPKKSQSRIRLLQSTPPAPPPPPKQLYAPEIRRKPSQ